MDSNIDERALLIPRDGHLSETFHQQKISIWFILLSAGLERLSFYSLAGNLVLFLTSDVIHWEPAHGLTVSFIFLSNYNSMKNSLNPILCFLGISYISAVFFAWLSDSKIGRAKTIVLGMLLYTNLFY